MTDRPTPRTDKAEYEVRLGRHRRMVVRPELARELELELADAHAEIATLRSDEQRLIAFSKRDRKRADDLSDKLAQVVCERDRLTQVIEAATVLIAAKGRHNTMLAYEGLRDALVKTRDNQNQDQ